ncbi:MAG: ribonuclease HI [Desulfobulbaceae bacterium S3730MH12]|nr:MAG: ribonuclease HI [Desulfobulbaceae bacterium S3730MH12]OEU82157.1 MAG: ribonuclease HI [Desulfobulbaceae bacterium C00003063]
MAKKKFYAVAVGRQCGIFTDWSITEKQVKGFGGAKYKSFSSRAGAEKWLDDPVYSKKASPIGKKTQRKVYPEDESTDIVIYTDGSSLNNPGPGGYGAVIIEAGREKELSGGYRLTTNNRMEMMAAIVALRQFETGTKPIKLYSDSSYLVNGINKGWVKKWQSNGWKKSDGQDVLNIDLWQELIKLTENSNVQFRWVKGHAGNVYNEQCDRLAVDSAKQKSLPVDSGYEARP